MLWLIALTIALGSLKSVGRGALLFLAESKIFSSPPVLLQIAGLR
jgi:hypothetical protein